MEPTQVDPLDHARSIVRKCMVRDACAELTVVKRRLRAGDARTVDSRLDRRSIGVSNIEPASSGGDRTAYTTRQVNKVQTTALYTVSFIVIVALVASHILGTFY